MRVYHPPVDEITGDYPTLRATTDQADPGLTQTTAIANATDLQNMNLDRAGNFYLTADIDLEGVSWTPIGLYTAETNFTNRFRGTLDGCGYTISNLTINLSSGWNSSLMGCLGPGAKIANLTLSNVNVAGDDYYTAALASDVICADGSDDILIQNCHASGIITSSGTTFRSCGGLIGELSRKAGDTTSKIYVYDCSSSCAIDMSNATSGDYRGGFVGYATRTTIQNCFATGSLTGGDGGDSYFGGFVGSIRNSTVSFCYATGNVSGANGRSGGFAGLIGDGSDIDSCYATGDVTGKTIVGGFAGQIEAGDVVPVDVYVTDCYSWGDATASGTISGGFCGSSSVASQHFDNCYSIGSATGTSSVGGFIGDAHPSLDVENCYWDTEASGNDTTDQNKGEGKTTAWLKRNPNYPAAWDFDDIWYQEYTAPVDGYWTGSDLSHLEGETVGILADGVVYPDQEVTDGDIDDTEFADATEIHIGLKYYSKLAPMKPLSQPDMMKKKATCKQMGISVHNTDDIQYGLNDNDMYDIDFDDPQWKNKCNVDGLFTGTVAVHVPDGFGVNMPLQITTDEPLPAVIRAMIPKVDVTGT